MTALQQIVNRAGVIAGLRRVLVGIADTQAAPQIQVLDGDAVALQAVGQFQDPGQGVEEG